MKYNFSLSIITVSLVCLLSLISSCGKFTTNTNSAPPAQREDSPAWPERPSGATPVVADGSGNNVNAQKAITEHFNENGNNSTPAWPQPPGNDTSRESIEKEKIEPQPSPSP
jgi:hypothetical protein